MRGSQLPDGSAADLQDVCDYVITRLDEADATLSVLKLHKLLYYIQAWHLALGRGRCFDEAFQAWVHGPVSRSVYDRFKDTKSMYSRVRPRDVREDFDPSVLPKKVRRHINIVLEAYGEFTDDQLEEMTHREKPWLEARGHLKPSERCENEISDATMEKFYSARLK